MHKNDRIAPCASWLHANAANCKAIANWTKRQLRQTVPDLWCSLQVSSKSFLYHGGREANLTQSCKGCLLIQQVALVVVWLFTLHMCHGQSSFSGIVILFLLRPLAGVAPKSRKKDPKSSQVFRSLDAFNHGTRVCLKLANL